MKSSEIVFGFKSCNELDFECSISVDAFYQCFGVCFVLAREFCDAPAVWEIGMDAWGLIGAMNGLLPTTFAYMVGVRTRPSRWPC